MNIQYPPTLPPLPIKDATLSQVAGLSVFTSASGVSSVKCTMPRPPIQFDTAVKLTTDSQISDFTSWFVHDTENGAKDFTVSLAILTGNDTEYTVRFAQPPVLKEIGTHTNRIVRVDMSVYILYPQYKAVADVKGAYPNISAPVTQTLTGTQPTVWGESTVPWGQHRGYGIQPPDSYKMTLLLSYADFRTFMGWWANKQANGALPFTAPILTAHGLQNPLCQAIKPWTAKGNAGDIEVSLAVGVATPPVTDQYRHIGIPANDWDDYIRRMRIIWTNLSGI